MTKDTEPTPHSLEKVERPSEPTPTSPLPAPSKRRRFWPLLIVGLVSAGLVCLIALIGVSAFFIIVNVNQVDTQVVGTVVVPGNADLLFEDHFNSAAGGWQTDPVEDELGRQEVTIAKGVYTLKVSSSAENSSYVERELPNQKFSDFILMVDITPHDRQEHYAYGVTFRQTEDSDSYVIELGNDRTYAVFLFADGWTTLQDWTYSEAIRPGETNRLTIIAEGEELSFMVNEEPLTTIRDDTLAEGGVGLVVEVFEEDRSAEVDFDDLIITKP